MTIERLKYYIDQLSPSVGKNKRLTLYMWNGRKFALSKGTLVVKGSVVFCIYTLQRMSHSFDNAEWTWH